MTRSRSDGCSETLVIRKRTRLLARAIAAILVCALVGQLVHAAFAASPSATEAPDFVLPSSTGKNIRLSELRSDVVAIAFVAEWCGDCSDQVRELEGVQREFADRGLQILTISFDRKSRGDSSAKPTLADPDGEVGKLYDIDDLPAVALVDRAGRLVAVIDDGRLVGADALRAAILPLVTD
jgi:peroxiredoxin